ncbi:hypothetical protein [Mucilaginibacter terrae]|uniref:DUF4352 domain-containing protein n=1 Tax=Mucilaginibacter terrae TaxID=1955052 RepID=A0ABU3GPV3_9SPHI|nr:hypothetical protein [Mucilaginibacter terrae]MDT3401561.1 hypothetical protein [Mucilaginibacter terrae]
MKKTLLLSVFAASVLFGCKSKDKNADSADSTTKTTEITKSSSTEPASTSPANEAKTYTITVSPDTALLGKSKEAFIKVIPISATELSTPEGKSEGIEVSFKISVTNKNAIGGNSVGVSPSEFRLQLDNNTSISQYTGSYVSADAESTKESEVIIYRIPAGTKPKTLNLFYDQTRASVPFLLK